MDVRFQAAWGGRKCPRAAALARPSSEVARMSMRSRYLALFAAWVAAIYGVLRLGAMPGDLGHALFGNLLCGPWG